MIEDFTPDKPTVGFEFKLYGKQFATAGLMPAASEFALSGLGGPTAVLWDRVVWVRNLLLPKDEQKGRNGGAEWVDMFDDTEHPITTALLDRIITRIVEALTGLPFTPPWTSPSGSTVTATNLTAVGGSPDTAAA